MGTGVFKTKGVGIRVLVNGSLGFAATNSLDLEDLYKTVENAYIRAKATSRLRKNPIEFSEERPGRAKYRVVEKKPLQELKIEDAINVLSEIL